MTEQTATASRPAISVVGQFFRNVATIYFGMIVGFLITFFFTPYLVGKLGKDLYGIWQLAFQILVYLGMVDVGMKQAIVRYISRHYANQEWVELNEVFSSSVKIYSIISATVVVVSLVIAYGLIGRFSIPDELVQTSRYVFLLLALDQVVTYFMIPFTALGAFHRFDISNGIRIARQVLQTVGIIFMLEMNYGMLYMAAVVTATGILMNLSMNWFRVAKFPEMKFSFKAIKTARIKSMFGYSVVSFLMVVAGIVIFQTDNIVIWMFISPAAVAVYSIGSALVNQLRAVVGIVATPLVPTISHYEARGEFEKINEIYLTSTRYLYFISTFVGVSSFLFAGPFILLWVGPEFTQSILVVQILIIGAALHLPQSMANSVLMGISKHRAALYVLVAEAIANIGLSIALVTLTDLGIIGVALGTTIPQLLIYSIIYPLVYHRTVKAELKLFYLTALRSIIIGLSVTIPTVWGIVHLLHPDTWMIFFGEVFLVTLAAGLVFSAFVLKPNDRQRIIDKVKQRLNRMAPPPKNEPPENKGS